MTDDEARRWACRYWDDVRDIDTASDADLAEAVRVWAIANLDLIDAGWSGLAAAWLGSGPLAFIRVVRSVVDGQ